MPTYEYACPTCGIVEHFQSIKDKALTKCPQCKKAKVTRLLSGGAGVIFKGSGFWETDYNRSSDYKSKEKADSGSTTSDKNAETAPKTQAAPKKADPAPTSSTTTSTAATPPPTKPPSSDKKPKP